MCILLCTVQAIYILYFGCSVNHGNYLLAKNVTPQEMKNMCLKARSMYL